MAPAAGCVLAGEQQVQAASLEAIRGSLVRLALAVWSGPLALPGSKRIRRRILLRSALDQFPPVAIRGLDEGDHSAAVLLGRVAAPLSAIWWRGGGRLRLMSSTAEWRLWP